ncbi:MAG: serine--tRNA ligase [Hyphomicrobiaceae bacterium]|nr:serine--tRNA ligase [Hyphomicrobiaceae bacterium]MCC0024563.1 serine--tRNA ligase [Hyphomicrobiaceae bacterium]
MFDIKWIRANADLFDQNLKRRGMAPLTGELLALDDERKAKVTAMNEAQEKRNALSKQIGQAKAQGDDARAEQIMAEVGSLKTEVQVFEEAARNLTEELNLKLSFLPNLLHADVPDGTEEADNVTIRTHLEPAKFAFAPKEHFEIGEALGQMDFEAAARMAGSRFVVLNGQLARLERALGQFMLDLHTREHGFTEVSAPLLVREQALFGTGQLPKFSEDAFETRDGRWLIPTSEVSLTNLVREQSLDQQDLPLRFTSLTPCFRSEAGSAGRDTRGMLRQHQFSKVEMVVVTTPDKSEQEQQFMLGCAEKVLQLLEIPYRVVILCSGDMGATMRRTYDIEAWLPGQNAYREISSVSMAGDYQARRMNTRYRNNEGKLDYVHTLNGSGIAVGRALIAVMENYQNEDGTVTIPEMLRPYMGGLERIG